MKGKCLKRATLFSDRKFCDLAREGALRHQISELSKNGLVIMMNTTKRILICAFVLIAIAFVIGLFPIHGEDRIYDSVLRLHVIANSDSEEDQALKLRVRDSIIDTVSEAVKGCTNRDEAIEKINSAMGDIQSKAQKTVADEGYDYPVNITLGEEYYPTKNYEVCCFPEGEYVSLRVEIGKSEGQNWWCCLFPPLCLGAATQKSKSECEDAFVEVGFTPDQYKIITETDTPKYKARFKILEVIENLF